ncbi:MAG: glutamate 5-kinase [Fusobacteriaceae bacterium]|nr:glutamate 5-kinase [Fusobacteriaceae bacterium]MBP6467442.1 glutamate 5-kinase [Fusobacteriaceae bacterium]MBU9917046.1 glutamate 5-kinase [Fusobacteriaceae bacterium]
MNKKEYLGEVKRVVIKVGTTTLTHETGLLNLERIEILVRQIANLHNNGYEVMLVTSGAIGAGMGKLNLKNRPKTLPEKQAVAAVGQVALIHLYQKIFAEYGKNVGQLLLTASDINERNRYLNGRNTCFALFNAGVIPIINENDAIAVEEIKVGDNDTLSAFVATLVDADLLIILSDIDGLYDSNPKENPNAKLLPLITTLNEEIKAMAGDSNSKFGTGGMATKIKAAEIALNSGVNMVIAQGEKPENLIKIVRGEDIGTLFVKNKKGLKAKKHWLQYSSKKTGKLIIDDGAKIAVLKHKSLLPSGIKEVEGSFQKGDVITVIDEEKNVLAVGIVNYSSDECQRILGKQSKEIEKILGYKDYDEVLHINNMSVGG